MAWRLGMRWRDFFKKLYQHYDSHAVSDTAAALTYYFIFSLFPFLFFLTTLAAYIPHVGSSVDTFLDRARGILPAQALSIVQDQAHGLVHQSRPHLLTISILVALYSASPVSHRGRFQAGQLAEDRLAVGSRSIHTIQRFS